MIYALYGSDTYRSHQKLHQIIEAYRIKAGAHIDLHRFDAHTAVITELKAIMDIPSLFTLKKLVIIENAFIETMAQIVDIARQWKDANDQHLVLMHGALDAAAKKYLASWKSILTRAQEFEELFGAKKEAWVRKEAADRGAALSIDQMRIVCMAPDSWGAVQEIEKIAVGGEIHIPQKQPTIFDLGDAFFTDKKHALSILHQFLENGADEFKTFSYLANHSRVLVAVKQCAEQKKSIPSWLGIHPFVAKKTAALARALTLAQCAALLFRFFEEDARIKTGLSQPKDSLVRMLVE